MAEHTKGPWLVNPFKAWVEVPDRDAPICALLWPTELRSEDETFANGRLIAAAPELLEALERIAGMQDGEQAWFARDIANAALSKATAQE